MVLSEELETLFFQATLLPLEDRLTFASKHCAGNSRMHQNLVRLLDAYVEPNDSLDRPLTLDADLLVFAGLHETCSDNASVLTELQGCLKPATQPGSLGWIGHFEVHEVLGRGASAIVLKATDQKLHRVVALKVLSGKLATDPSARKRFTREARIAARVTGQNLVTIYDVQDQFALPIIVMEYFSAISLYDYLKLRAGLSVEETVDIAVKICKGLSKVHAEKIAHRDLKPGNVLVHPETQEVKITDFGIAKAFAGSDDEELTLIDQVLGTPTFMSPEQVEGRRPDARSDLFSLGTILYRMLTQALPFDGPNAQSVMIQILNCSPKPVHELVPEVPEWLSNLVSRLHEKNPDDRYQTAEQVIDVLEAGRTQKQSDLKSVPLPSARSVDALQSSEKHSEIVKRGSKRRVWMYVAPAIIAAIMGILLKLQTASGELIVMCDDPNAKLEVEASNGVVTERWKLEIGESNRLRLELGPWKISLIGESADQYFISENEVQVVRGGVVVVKISKKAKSNSADWDEPANVLRRKTPIDPAIEALLTGGAMLAVSNQNGEEVYCSKLADLPDVVFNVQGIYLGDRSTWSKPLNFELLAKFPKVSFLDFSSTEFSDADIAQLSQFRELDALDLRDTEVSDAGMTILANGVRLSALSLEGTAVTADGLRELARMRSLGSLTVSGEKIDDDAMRAIAEFSNLYSLSCINCRLTDAGIQHLTHENRWQQFTFCGTDITDSGIALLCRMPNLKTLILESNRKITDACVDDLLLSSLAEIDVRRTGISSEGRRRLTSIRTFHGSPDEP